MSRITTPFTRENTADEVIAGIDLTGRRAVVTGGASGIGVETARVLAAAGAEVTLAVRNLKAGERVAAEITASTGNKSVLVAPLELADRASVRAFGANWQGPLHILVNNAGVMAEPLNRTPEGWEHQFATNHLGHFGLALGLHPALAAAGNARIVSVSSSAHRRSGIVFDDIQFERRPYEPWAAYAQSKTANVLFAVEATKRWAPDGITANALMPGGIRTALQRHQDPDADPALKEIFDNYPGRRSSRAHRHRYYWQPPLCSTGIGGRYFEDNNEAGPNVPPNEDGVADHALDPEAATRLWEVSLDLLLS